MARRLSDAGARFTDGAWSSDVLCCSSIGCCTIRTWSKPSFASSTLLLITSARHNRDARALLERVVQQGKKLFNEHDCAAICAALLKLGDHKIIQTVIANEPVFLEHLVKKASQTNVESSLQQLLDDLQNRKR